MAKKPTKTMRKSKKNSKNQAEPILSSNLKREIVAIVLAALTILLVFADIGFGGPLVTDSFHSIRVTIGWTAFLLPLITGVITVLLFRRDDPPRALNYMGYTTLLLALATLLHVGYSGDQAMTEAQLGNGGGYVGLAISSMMLNFLNSVAASVVLVTVIIVSIILASNTRFGDVIRAIIGLFKKPALASEAGVVGGNLSVAGLKVNDNSGTSLPFKGELKLGGGPTGKRIVTPAEPQEALTLSADDSWVPPSLDLLVATSTKADAGDIKANASIIQHTMESFGIGVQMAEVNVGPTVTQYTFIPPAGVKLNKITTLDTNLALSLAAHPIRIEAPIPGKSAVGVEIPNKKIAVVRLRDILTTPEVQRDKMPLTFVLGRDVSGNPMTADLAKMPHMLIAGATGSGKSVMINALLTSLLYRNSPNDLKMILVDPKRVELGLYNNIPHLLTPVIVEPEKCISALKWAVAEMERRYIRLAEVGNKNIIEYNKAHRQDAMPYIVIVIDELADLMVLAANDVESLIVRLAQMARAVGIHLVLATQRPSVDIITGIIKANIPARLAFSVASQIDSRTILDQMGAEKLLGKGDMLFASPDYIKPRRIQGVFVSEDETKAVSDYLRGARQPQYNEEVLSQKVNIHGGRGAAGGGGGGGNGDIDDDLFESAAEAVIRAGKASTSMLQRRLRVGYARAARLIDLLEEQGIVGPADGARPREVLVSSLDAVRGAGGGGGSGAMTMTPGSAAAAAAEPAMRMAEPYDE